MPEYSPLLGRELAVHIVNRKTENPTIAKQPNMTKIQCHNWRFKALILQVPSLQ
jgi:hypothetical protein